MFTLVSQDRILYLYKNYNLQSVSATRLFYPINRNKNIPASSASIERMFPKFDVIHTKLRNRFGKIKASKLVFCYRVLRGQSEIDYLGKIMSKL